MTLFYIIIVILALILIAGIAQGIYNFRKHRKRSPPRPVISVRASPQNTVRRMPYRVTASRSLSARIESASATQRRRVPHPVQNNECLRYRKCPRCHSENTLAKQYIFRTGDRSYLCTRCHHRFNF